MAFMIDVFARWSVGWRASISMNTDFVPDDLEQALNARIQNHTGGLIYHSGLAASAACGKRLPATIRLDNCGLTKTKQPPRGQRRFTIGKKYFTEHLFRAVT